MLARAANGGEAQEYLMGVTAANMLAMGKQILKRVAREREGEGEGMIKIEFHLFSTTLYLRRAELPSCVCRSHRLTN